MATGTLKWFDLDRGYGFIAPDGSSQDIFVHVSELAFAGIDNVESDDRLSFDIGQALATTALG